MIYLVRFNTKNCHFVRYMLTRASNFKTYNNTTIINNEDKKILNKKKMLKLTQFCKF